MLPGCSFVRVYVCALCVSAPNMSLIILVVVTNLSLSTTLVRICKTYIRWSFTAASISHINPRASAVTPAREN